MFAFMTAKFTWRLLLNCVHEKLYTSLLHNNNDNRFICTALTKHLAEDYDSVGFDSRNTFVATTCCLIFNPKYLTTLICQVSRKRVS